MASDAGDGGLSYKSKLLLLLPVSKMKCAFLVYRSRALGHLYLSVASDAGDGGLRCAKECAALHARLSVSHRAERERVGVAAAAAAAVASRGNAKRGRAR